MPLRKATQAVISPNICTTDTTQTISGAKTFSSQITGNVTGNLTGNVSGNVSGNVTGNVSGNVTGNVTGNATTATTLQTSRTINVSGAVTGTATAFNGSSNITIPTTISSGATIESPNFSGTAAGSLISKIIKGITDGSNASIGYIGELLSQTSSLSTIASNTIANGASITLTPGNWEVYGNATFNFSGVTASVDLIGASISSVSATMQENQRQVLLVPAITTISQTPAYAFVTPKVRFNVTTNTVVYIVVQSPVTTAGTMQFSTIISANRVR